MAKELDKYKAKRRFDKTAEPSGEKAVGGDEQTFVIQKHAARRLHYDLRLKIAGTLKSWAVPEGPSLDPKVRRLAVHVEDHPLDYASFEGEIAEGNYGAGTVIVWDRGTWVTLEDPEKQLAEGGIKFRLLGEKLRGGWMLKRIDRDPKNWLLIKERDTEARPIDEYDVLVEEPNSVVTGRPVEAPLEVFAPVARKQLPPPNPKKIAGAVAAAKPAKLQPQLAGTASMVPNAVGWVHEIKFDGYRTLVHIENGEVKLITRNGHDWTARYVGLADAFKKLPCKSAIIDGEIIVTDARGVSSLNLIEQALSEGRRNAFTYYGFDLPYLDGYDLTRATLLDRKAALEALLSPVIDAKSPIQYSEHVEGDGSALFAHACRMGLEGVISKKADSKYVQTRSNSWLKVKRLDLGEYVVIGFKSSAPKHVTSLAMAEDTERGLIFVGNAGSGINDELGRRLFDEFGGALRKDSIVPTPRMPEVKWIEPRWNVQIGYRGLSENNAPRAPVVMSVSPRIVAEAHEPVMPKLVSDRDLAGIRLTNPEREIFEGSGTSKLDIALYYARVGDWMLPELMRRPVSLIRSPTGSLRDLFYQRHAFHGLPEGIGKIDLATDDEERAAYIYIEEPKGFLALAQFGAIELHPWGCHVDDPEHPDRIVMDLDPAPDVSWPQVCGAAELLREKLKSLGFEPFLRTTGGKGVHLVVALAPKQTWPVVKGIAEAIARACAKDWPDIFTAVASKEKRKGRIYVDYLRNGRGASAVASYSLRANINFTVATPIEWKELRTLPGANAFDRKTVLKRLDKLVADPWSELSSHKTSITAKMRRDVGMKD